MVSSKEIVDANKRTHDQSISQEDRINSMMAFTKLVQEAREKLERNAEKEVIEFMSGFLYRSTRPFISA